MQQGNGTKTNALSSRVNATLPNLHEDVMNNAVPDVNPSWEESFKPTSSVIHELPEDKVDDHPSGASEPEAIPHHTAEVR